jgi:hypothetical protein
LKTAAPVATDSTIEKTLKLREFAHSTRFCVARTLPCEYNLLIENNVSLSKELMMKSVFLALALMMPLAAQAKEVKVTGVRAEALIDVGDKLGINDNAMGGRVHLEMSNVDCRKTVDDKDDQITCTFVALDPTGQGQTKKQTVSTKDEKGGEVAVQLRKILRELTNAEKKVSPTEKRVTAKQITCDGAGYGHELDDVDYETSAECTIR